MTQPILMTFLNKTLLSTCLVAGALCTSPLAERQSAGVLSAVAHAERLSETPSPAQVAHDRDFPVPEHGLVITQETCGNLAALLTQFSAVTGEALVYSNEMKALLENRETGLHQSLTIDPADVYATVQDILVANRIVLSDLGRTNPRMLMVESSDSGRRASLRQHARFVPEAHLAAYVRDSALMITTVLSLPHTNARTASNTLRSMVVDSNTMQLMAVQDTQSFVLTGFGTSVNSMAGVLYAMEEDAARRHEEREAGRRQEPAEQPSGKSSKK